MIWVFDICNTLYNSNTTYDFIQFFLQRNGNKKQIAAFKKIVSRKSIWFWIYGVLNKLTRKDFHKKAVVKLLSGFGKKELHDEALKFYESNLAGKKIEVIFDKLSVARQSNQSVFLISSTIDPVAFAISEKLGITVYSSCMGYETDLCTGLVQKEISGRKHEIAEMKFAGQELAVVTDNFSDYTLVEMASEKYVVIYNSKDKQKWQRLHPIFLEVKV